MAMPFFEAVIDNAIDTNPNQTYRDRQQAYVDSQWDNTSAMVTVQEQSAIGSSVYTNIDVWITPTVSDTTRGSTDPYDFNKIVFQSITHTTERGRMYKLDNNYWIVHSYAPYNGLVQDCGIRRCNNALRMIDPKDGSVFEIPCCVDYDMSAASVQVSRYVITPNNHAVVIAQGNDDTIRLFRTNTRFLLGGRPFRLTGYQNTIYQSIVNEKPTLLVLDLYLDELRADDNIDTGIADNGTYTYSIAINGGASMTLPSGSTGTLTADVKLNGMETTRDIVWSSSNSQVVKINAETGAYEIIGESGSAVITAMLDFNNAIKDSVTITVGAVGQDVEIVTSPVFSTIRQHGSISFKVEAYVNGTKQASGVTVNAATTSSHMTLTRSGDEFTLACDSIAADLQTLTISAQSANPAYNVSKSISIKTTSMMG